MKLLKNINKKNLQKQQKKKKETKGMSIKFERKTAKDDEIWKKKLN